MDDEQNALLDDCYYYLYSSCRNEGRCEYRHCPATKQNPVLCEKWDQTRECHTDCPYRHSYFHLKKRRSQDKCYWEAQEGGCKKEFCEYMHENPEKDAWKEKLENEGTGKWGRSREREGANGHQTGYGDLVDYQMKKPRPADKWFTSRRGDGAQSQISNLDRPGNCTFSMPVDLFQGGMLNDGSQFSTPHSGFQLGDFISNAQFNGFPQPQPVLPKEIAAGKAYDLEEVSQPRWGASDLGQERAQCFVAGPAQKERSSFKRDARHQDGPGSQQHAEGKPGYEYRTYTEGRRESDRRRLPDNERHSLRGSRRDESKLKHQSSNSLKHSDNFENERALDEEIAGVDRLIKELEELVG